MSKKTEKLEKNIEKLGKDNIGNSIPSKLPDWMITEGILAGTLIESADRMGQGNSKTDVIIRLLKSNPIKISAKLSNADYFGNWYGHERVINEFGLSVFETLSQKVTEWANKWLQNDQSDLFVGVSVSFGGRSGDTTIKFLDVFQPEDVLKIAKGTGSGDDVANALFVKDKCPSSIQKLVESLEEISQENIKSAVNEFYIICRPVNPMTNITNRGKCTYTMFKPYKRLDTLTTIKTKEELRKLGRFVPIDWSTGYRMNHNRVLDILHDCYNIDIEKKK